MDTTTPTETAPRKRSLSQWAHRILGSPEKHAESAQPGAETSSPKEQPVPEQVKHESPKEEVLVAVVAEMVSPEEMQGDAAVQDATAQDELQGLLREAVQQAVATPPEGGAAVQADAGEEAPLCPAARKRRHRCCICL